MPRRHTAASPGKEGTLVWSLRTDTGNRCLSCKALQLRRSGWAEKSQHPLHVPDPEPSTHGLWTGRQVHLCELV